MLISQICLNPHANAHCCLADAVCCHNAPHAGKPLIAGACLRPDTHTHTLTRPRLIRARLGFSIVCLPLSPTLNEQRIYCETFSSFGSLFFLRNLLQCLIAVQSGDMHFACVCPGATRRQRIKKKQQEKNNRKTVLF